MNFHTVVRDCLYLNWALPEAHLPKLEEPLRYDVREWRGEGRVFASAALFRVERLHLRRLPLFKLSHPQFMLRLCVVDGEGLPAFYLASVLLPAWAVPGARLVAGQPAAGGQLEYPPPGALTEGGEPRWRVRRLGALSIAVAPAAPTVGDGPDFGSWEATVSYFQRRHRDYYRVGAGLRRLEFSPRKVAAVPVEARVEDGGLLTACLGGTELDPWPALHSAWFCSENAYILELGNERTARLPRQVPAPG